MIRNQPKRCLNYVWINQDSIQDNKESVLQGVPPQCLEQAFKNAEAYPETPVNIWVDYDLIDQTSRSFLESHGYTNSAPANITFNNLNDIPEYATNPHFKPSAKKHVAAKSDFARFLVMQHCFDTTDVDDVFYADFDVEDVKLNDEKVVKNLSRNHMIFGAVETPFPIDSHPENGYLGLRRGEGSCFLKDFLLQRSGYALSRNKNGFEMFQEALKSWFGNKGKFTINYDDIAISILKPMYHRMPETDFSIKI